MNFLLRQLIVFVFTLILVIPSEAQKKVRLTNKESKQEIFLEEGQRIKYILNDQDGKVVGILKKVDSEQLVVDESTIRIVDIKAIGRKKKGSGAGTGIFAFLGGSVILISLAPGVNCLTCQTDTNAVNSGKALGTIAGLSLAAIALHIGAKNSPKDVSKKWQLDIVD